MPPHVNTPIADESDILYREHPLDPELDQIRLLHINPGTWEDPIECAITVVSRHDRPFYLALSYVWAEETAEDSIKISGRSVKVRPNLHAALRRIRAHGRCDTIWIDALCINQEDIGERNHQVAQMRQIYQNCTEVLVWFGQELERPKPNDECFEFTMTTALQKNSSLSEEAEANIRSMGTTDWQLCSVFDLSTRHQIVQTARNFDLPSWETVQSVCNIFCFAHEHDYALPTVVGSHPIINDECEHFWSSNPWFTRLWVVQEFVLAPKRRLLFGPVSMDFTVVEKANARNECSRKTHKEPTLLAGESALCATLTSLARLRANYNHQPTLFECRIELGNRQASLAVDHMYSLLGLVRHTILPDYGKPAEQVLVAIIQDHINSKSLLPLAFSGAKRWDLPRELVCNEDSPKLPSWAIDWTQWQPHGFQAMTWSKIYDSFRASHGMMGTYRAESPYLLLQGLFLDRITRLEHRMSIIKRRSNKMYWVQEYLKQEERKGQQTYMTGELWQEALVRTGLTNRLFSNPHDTDSPPTPLTDDEVAMLLDERMPTGPWHSIDISHHSLRDRQYQDLVTSVLFATSALGPQKVFITEQDYLGLCPRDCKPGTLIFIAAGCNMPIIVESVEGATKDDAQVYKFWGCCYLHGFMDGIEEIKALGVDLPEPEKLVLV